MVEWGVASVRAAAILRFTQANPYLDDSSISFDIYNLWKSPSHNIIMMMMVLHTKHKHIFIKRREEKVEFGDDTVSSDIIL